jgi:predicted DNA-binding transcriptional regulator AlpA
MQRQETTGDHRRRARLQEPLWGVVDVAGFLNVPIKTIYQWRTQGYGPKGRRVGRYIRYDPTEVRSWFESLESSAE